MDGRYRKDGDQTSQHEDVRPTTSSSSSTASRSLSPISTFTPIYPPGGNTTPLKFATSTNAFNLAVSPTSSSSSRDGQHGSMILTNERSPPQAGTSTIRRSRRPSMLALSQPTGPAEVDMSRENSGQDGVGVGVGNDGHDQGGESVSPRTRLSDVSPTDTRSNPFGFGQATSRWNPSGSLFNTSLNAAAFAHSISGQGGTPPLEPPDSKNLTPPRLHSAAEMDDGSRGDSQSPFDMEMGEEQRSPLRFLPSHLQTSASRRKGKGKMDDLDHLPLGSPITGPPGSTPHPEGETVPLKPFNRKPLPASLVATLISESQPLEHEIQSEARLQRFIHSHPPRLPLTPRISKSTRGRFPEMADNEDDDEDDRRPSWRGRQWMGMRSDSDSDSDDDGEPVNSAFAAGMDLDRPVSMSSSSSSAVWPSGNVSESGKMTPGGLALGPAGGGAGAGGPVSMAGTIGFGSGTGQPTPPPGNTTWGGAQRPSRLSFGAGMIPSPGNGFQLPGAFGGLGMGGGGTPLGSPTIERLELGASPGAVSASSPSLMAYRESQGGSASVRPGKRKAQPDDRFDPYKRPRGSSPSLAPMSPSQRATSIPIPSSPFAASNSTRRTYASRPLSSRSRQASPALSIGSTSGVLSTSLGNSVGKGVGGSFMPTGPAAAHAAHQAQGPQLGGLGLLSLANVGEDVEGEGAAEGNSRGSSTRPSRSGSGSRLGQNIDLDQEGDSELDEDEDEDAMEED